MSETLSSKKPIVVIALVTAVCMLGNEMLFIVLPLYWKFFGLESLWQVGILLSANRLIRIPINSSVGWCYKRIGKRSGILIAVMLAVISTFSYGVLKGFWPLLLTRFFWGIAWSFFRLGGYLTVISCSNSRTRGQNVGLYNGLWGLGTLFGMLFGGLSADLIGIRTITTLFSIAGICSIPFILGFIPNTKSVEVQQEKKKDSLIWRNRRILSSFATGLISAFIVYGVFASTLSKLMDFHMEKKWLVFGLAIGASSITGIIQAIRTSWEPFLAPYLGRCSDSRWGRIPLLIIALFSAACCFTIFPLKISMSIFIFILFLFQLTTTLLITMSDSIATDVASGKSQVTVIAYYTLFVDVGSALGPLLGYVIIDAYGIKWLFWLTVIIIVPLLSYWIYVWKKEGNSAALMQSTK
ncbi:hypothetical protein AN964_02920 [Heyndrickxia shackletonii]|uniref:Major facilitator superfamily (MFS) profile domain-containing protein n=1 Tax=Heyndrickxia shackletonii TaxID=157838 RepID=A0A0Q3WUV7_9BACI|nr:MFS transporter [Heyndrickxia shackletonii]KQL52587.1 hypothetical protein AN964_02920 [Heyndrickxia shackletonii]NEZ00216.1 MFS transporter [Heyndrickxia shackletonii]